ncbi:MAG: HAD hydrolase-like protein [Anaerolineales bacterium]|nr:HAD hydrolase-like protein [Anaerolineales bacterium]
MEVLSVEPAVPPKIAWDLGDTLVRIKAAKMCEGAAKISICTGRYTTKSQLESAIKLEWADRKDPYHLDVIRNVANLKTEVMYWEEDFYPSVLKRLEIDKPQKNICAWFAAMQISPKSFELMPDAVETLELLKSAEIEQALLSNAFPSAKKIVKYHKLQKYFKVIIFSFDYKLVKPDERIYEILEERFNLGHKDKIIFVDDRKEFLQIPKHLNIIPVWLNCHQYQADDWSGERISNVKKVLSYCSTVELMPDKQHIVQGELI